MLIHKLRKMNKITQIILDNLSVNISKAVNKELFKVEEIPMENEFLLILKPEIFAFTSKSQIQNIIDLVLIKLYQYDFKVTNARLINSYFLKQHKVMDQHYGIINAAARKLSSSITEEAIRTFEHIYNCDFASVQAFGAIELLEQNRIDEETLSNKWKDCEIKRLAGGIYCGKVQLNGNDLFIINGFHPPQLNHFIAEGRMIVTMNIQSNTDWEIARQEMTGNTYPEKASPNSIRGYLFQKYNKYGFDHVSYVLNSIHLSAGPLEGLIELQRFNSNYDTGDIKHFSDFNFGNRICQNFTTTEIDQLIANPTVNLQGKQVSLFDLTEEKNSSETLKQFIELKQNQQL